MPQKKLGELIGSIFFTLIIIGLSIWFALTLNNYQSPKAQSFTSILKEAPLTDLEEAEVKGIIPMKNLKTFGRVPIKVLGEERSKNINIFQTDEGVTESPTLVTDYFTLLYPKNWSKTLDQKNNIKFDSPLIENQSIGSVKLIIEDYTTEKLSQSLKPKAKELLSGLDNLKIGDFVGSDTDKVQNGRVNYSYTLGDQERIGWVQSFQYASPNQTLANEISSTINNYQSRSRYLKTLKFSKTLPDIKKLLEDSTLTDELISLGVNVKYNVKPYSKLVILIFDANKNQAGQIEPDANIIANQIKFIDSVTFGSEDSLPVNESENPEIEEVTL